jgi:hypothetical protein
MKKYLAVMRYFVIKGPQQINNDMSEVLGESISPYRVVQNWSRDFKLDRQSC